MKKQKHAMKRLSRACQTNRCRYNPNRKTMLANQKPEKRVITCSGRL